MSEADWTVQLDSDHELLPGAIEKFAELARSATFNIDIGILGARFQWDDGNVTPVNVPLCPIDYVGRIQWCNRPDGIGADHLFCISRRVREKVKWPCFRGGGVVDTLFHLEIARVAKTIFTDKCLALQKSNAPAGHTRGPTLYRLARRQLDADDAVKLTDLTLERHGSSLKDHGKRFYGDILQAGAYYALLSGQKRKSQKWLIESVRAKGLSIQALGLSLGLIGGLGLFRLLYRIRG